MHNVVVRRARRSGIAFRVAVAIATVAAGSSLGQPLAGAAPATVAITMPTPDGANGWHVATPTITVQADEPASGVRAVELLFDGVLRSSQTFASPYPPSATRSAQPPSPGEVTATGRATSGTGEVSTASATVRWDPDQPSDPGTPVWYSETTGLDEAVSAGDDRVCAQWDASFDWVSGVAGYRVQVSESPDFSSVLVDRTTNDPLARACFDAADGIQTGHAYYARVLGRDVAGNTSAFSPPSSRVAVTDEQTGPAVVHAPVVSSFVGHDITIDAVATCNGDVSGCSARVFYRRTAIDGSLTNVFASGWSMVDMTALQTDTVDGRSAQQWRGVIPGDDVSTTGVDYFVEVEDTYAVTHYPGTTFVGTPDTPGVEPTPAFFHVEVMAPPTPVHAPPPFGHAGEALPVTFRTNCSTGACSARLYFRTTDGPVTADPITAVPDWPRVDMTATAADPAGDLGDVVTFTADVPGAYVETAGVDYFFSVTDGEVTSWWPGTRYVGHYSPTDGMRTLYHHVHVLETPHVVHVPPAAAAYRQPLMIEATASCATVCEATLHHRTAGTTQFTTSAMTVSPLADGAVSIRGDVPATLTDTRGVDYFIDVTDGSTTTFWPGTSSVDGYVTVDGQRVAHHHVRVLERPHVAHVPPAAVPALQDLAIDVTATCATEACALTLYYAASALAPSFTAVPFSIVGDETPTALGRSATYRAVVPAADVTTAGLAYYVEAFDGHVTTHSPGTSDNDAYVFVGGFRAGAYVARVLEPPHVVHAPIATAYYRQPLLVEARSNCVGSCTATLHWRTSGHPWQSTPMVAAAETGGAVVGDVWSYRATIDATGVTTEGVDYRIEVTDGYASESTPTAHVTVLAPTAIVHQPVVTTFPGRSVPIEAVVPCSTAACSVNLSYRAADGGLLGEPAWTTVAMSPSGAATPVGDATSLARYVAEIPADVVTTRGVDYFIHSTDGHTNAYSPGTAYAATQLTRVDGTGVHYFHVHVAEPIRIVHAPVAVAAYQQPLAITATVNCATRACSGVLEYRVSPRLTTPAGLLAYVAGLPAFTAEAMTARTVQDLGDAGTVVELTATIPAEVVTTEGLDYRFSVTDGDTTAHYPGTSYVAGAGGVDGIGVAWQHVEVPLRSPVRAIAHAPVMASPVRQPIALRFATHCTVDEPCTPTVWYRTTPVPAGGATDLGQILLAEPNWTVAAVRTVSARPDPSGAVAHVFEAEIPAEAVDSRGVDYVLKVADRSGAMYWPALPYQSAVAASSFPLIAHHVHALTAPVIAHTPAAAATAGSPVALSWRFVCSADLAAHCRTAAYHRHLESPSVSTASLSTVPAPTVALGPTPPPFVELATTATLVGQVGDSFVFEATAVVPGAATGYEQYYLWAGDGHTNAYSPGTSYIGGPVPSDGMTLGDVVPWTVRRV